MTRFYAALTILLAAGFSARAQPLPSVGDPAIVAYTIVDGREIPESLTGRAGDPEAGSALYLDAARTGCILCHGVPKAAGPPLPPADGIPALDGVGARLSPGRLRLWIVAPAMTGAEKPSLYAPGQRTDPDDPLHGGPTLTASEVEDLVAWLESLATQE
ncbi:MAG: c-type cytochrome [Pseudomonadota bacterium]